MEYFDLSGSDRSRACGSDASRTQRSFLQEGWLHSLGYIRRTVAPLGSWTAAGDPPFAFGTSVEPSVAVYPRPSFEPTTRFVLAATAANDGRIWYAAHQHAAASDTWWSLQEPPRLNLAIGLPYQSESKFRPSPIRIRSELNLDLLITQERRRTKHRALAQRCTGRP